MAQRHCWGGWGLYLDPKDAEKPHLKIFLGAPYGILTPLPVTLRKYQGINIFASKIISSYDVILYVFLGFTYLSENAEKFIKQQFQSVSWKLLKMTKFLHNSQHFSQNKSVQCTVQCDKSFSHLFHAFHGELFFNCPI